MLNCQKITRLLALQQEEEYSWLLAARIKAHLLICPRCKNFHLNNQQLTHILQTFKKEHF